MGMMSREIKDSALNDASQKNAIVARDESFAKIKTLAVNMEAAHARDWQQFKTAMNNYEAVAKPIYSVRVFSKWLLREGEQVQKVPVYLCAFYEHQCHFAG